MVSYLLTSIRTTHVYGIVDYVIVGKLLTSIRTTHVYAIVDYVMVSYLCIVNYVMVLANSESLLVMEFITFCHRHRHLRIKYRQI